MTGPPLPRPPPTPGRPRPPEAARGRHRSPQVATGRRPSNQGRPIKAARSQPSDQYHIVAVADLVAVIERAAADLALAEEPARFIAALEAGAPAPEGPTGP